jgi:hypothetical protein
MATRMGHDEVPAHEHQRSAVSEVHFLGAPVYLSGQVDPHFVVANISIRHLQVAVGDVGFAFPHRTCRGSNKLHAPIIGHNHEQGSTKSRKSGG